MTLSKTIKNITKFHISIFFVFFLHFVQSNSQTNVKSVIGIEPNTDFIDNTIFLQPDTLNQLKLSSISNKSFHILQLDGIPLFSLFDGQYNYTFLKNFNLKNTGSNFNAIKLSKPHSKDSLSADVILFSSNYNGLLQAKIFKKKNSLEKSHHLMAFFIFVKNS